MSIYPLYDRIIDYFIKEPFNPLNEDSFKNAKKKIITPTTGIEQNKDNYASVKSTSNTTFKNNLAAKENNSTTEECIITLTVSAERAYKIIAQLSSEYKDKFDYYYDSNKHELTIAFKEKYAISNNNNNKDANSNINTKSTTNNQTIDKKKQDYEKAVSALKDNKSDSVPTSQSNNKPTRSRQYDKDFIKTLYDLLLKSPNVLPNLNPIWTSMMGSISWEDGITQFFKYYEYDFYDLLDAINEELKKNIK